MSEENKYEKSDKERSESVNKILISTSSKKVVVAGPGTGKTFLFKEILKNKSNTLTLTFVNSLVEDLSLELYGMSDVRTLHSYARGMLAKLSNSEINVFHKFSRIVKEDAKILLNVEIDSSKLFHERDDDNDHLKFFKKRRDYYNYYGYASIIFAIVKYFEKYKEKVPIYEQILIDEFQDFNLLEVSLIDLLSEKSPILLAGDDDQALYVFKSAKTKYIRERYSGVIPEYEAFTLPYCSRCTNVVVEATNDVINEAKKHGLLNGRIEKEYKYFNDEKKNKICELHPKISYAQVFDKQIPWFIEKSIKELVKQERKSFSALIISPYKKQSHNIADSLIAKGFQNIDFVIKDDDDINILDGFKLLIENKNDNLGWRIVTKFILPEEDFISLIKGTDAQPDKPIKEFLTKEYRDKINCIYKVLKYIKEDKPINKDDFDKATSTLDISSYSVIKEYLYKQIDNNNIRTGDPALRKIPIKSTTIQSSKGLAADIVFITHFDDRYFIKDTNVTDQDICNFLVAITRTRNKLFLISSLKEEPTFLKWLNKDRYEKVTD
ncbi:MAG: ATP-dependent helicase [Melioribacteraceae bacterium]|nr:ATP-dependent helicase [Melioribacteraceae bacterium]